MFRSIFRPYGLVWTVLNTVTDVVGLTLCWLLCCLPVVTLFPATAALYDAVVHGIRYREEGPYKRFFRTFRRSGKAASSPPCFGARFWAFSAICWRCC